MNIRSIKFITTTIIIFLLISIILDRVVYLIFNKVSDQVYTGQSIGKLNHFLQIKNNCNLIIFGSSRANHNIDPSVLDSNSFNMGMDGRKLAYAHTLISLLPIDKKQTILLHIDPENAFSTKYKGNDVQVLTTKYNRNNIIRSAINNLNQENLFQRLYYSLSYNGKVFGIIKNYLRPSYNYKKYNGYDPINVTASQTKLFEKSLAKTPVKKKDSNLVLNPIYERLLDELKLLASQNNKKIILFTSPVFNDDYKSDNLKLKDLLNDKGLKYKDYSDFFIQDKSLKYWKDRTHLSKKGAEIFTDNIKSILD